MNGGSQAVRLPKEFRFEGNAVRVYRDGNRVVLEPIDKPQWPASFFDALAASPLSEDFRVAEQPEFSEYRQKVIDELADS